MEKNGHVTEGVKPVKDPYTFCGRKENWPWYMFDQSETYSNNNFSCNVWNITPTGV